MSRLQRGLTGLNSDSGSGQPARRLSMAGAGDRQGDQELRGTEAAHPRQAGRQARPVARQRPGGRHAAPRDPPGRRAPVRHRKPAAQPHGARAPHRRGARRDLRLRPAGSAAQGPDDQRHPDQRAAQDLRRAPRQAGEDATSSSATTTTCCRSSTASCRRSAGASTRRRRWWTPACRTAAASTPSSRRWPWTAPSVSHSPLRRQPAEAGRPAQLQGVHARDGDAHGGVHQGPPQHRHQRRHRLR